MAFTTTRRRATTKRRPSWPGSERSRSSRRTSPEPRCLAEHRLRPRLALAELFGHEPLVESGRHGRIAGARQHGRKLPALELLERPLEGIRPERLVEIDALVLVLRPVVIVRVDAEAVEREQLDLLAGDVAEDVNGETAVALTGDTHLETEPDVAGLDHVRPPVVTHGAAPPHRHLAGLGLELVQHGQQLRGIDLQRELLVAGAPEHRGQLPAQLGHRPPERIPG